MKTPSHTRVNYIFSPSTTLCILPTSVVVETILTYCIVVWYAGCSVAESKEKIIGCSLPSLDNITTSRYLNRANKIITNSSHPGHEQKQ